MNRKQRRGAGKAGPTKTVTLPQRSVADLLLPASSGAALASAPTDLPPADPVAAAFARLKRDEAEAEAIAAAEKRALASDDAGAWLKLGSLRAKAGQKAAALEAFRRCIAIAPDLDEVRHMIAALGGEVAPARASDAYVANVFDAMAERFDDTLVTFLDYRAPEILAGLVERRLGERRMLDIVDLGCGTGLMAPHLKPRARRLVGIDLSAEMLRRAEARGGYDSLQQAEISAWLDAHPAAFDLAVAADVFCYFGELAPVLASTRGALRPGGRLLFTVEAKAGESWTLGTTGRYQHAESYVRGAAEQAGLTLTDLDKVRLRIEHGAAVEGFAVALLKDPG